MKLSIIIPLYNSGHFLPTCLDSLFKQDLKESDYEILIINDGSTDNSLDIALAYANKHSNVKIHSKVNGGVGSARNVGISMAKAEYIYFIDPDDYLASNVLGTLLQTADENDLDILTFKSRQTKDSGLYHTTPDLSNMALHGIVNGIDYIASKRFQNEVWWYFIKLSFLKDTEVRFIEDRWMEDAILTTQLFINAKRMSHLPLDAHRHLIVEGSAMTSKEPIHYLNVIDDNRNAALVFESMIDDLEEKVVSAKCIKRLRTRQQSFVFFMMVRMLRSTIKLKDVKATMSQLSQTNAYPLNIFPGEDYKGWAYRFLVKLFNSKKRFYFLFRVFNPVLKKIS